MVYKLIVVYIILFIVSENKFVSLLIKSLNKYSLNYWKQRHFVLKFRANKNLKIGAVLARFNKVN